MSRVFLRTILTFCCLTLAAACSDAPWPLGLASQIELRIAALSPVVVLPASQQFRLVARNVSAHAVAYSPTCFGLGATIFRADSVIDVASAGCPESPQDLAQLAPGDSLVTTLLWAPMFKGPGNIPHWVPEGRYAAEARFIAARGGMRGPRVTFEIRAP